MTTADAEPGALVSAHLAALHGPDWAAGAHQAVLDLAQKWSLTLGHPLTGGALSLCLDALTADGTHVVLKVPCTPATGRLEAAALARFPSGVVPAVHATDEATGAILLGFVPALGVPPTPIQANRLAVHLHHRAADGLAGVFPDLADNLATRLAEARHRHASDPALADATGDPDRAAALVAHLLATAPNPVLLHGDFQDKNIIVPPRSGVAVAIDPLPCLGDPTFDLALWAVSRQHHQQSLAHTLACLHTPDQARNDRLDRWAWALAVVESRPGYDQPWGHQRDFVTGYRHLADLDDA